MTRKQIVIAALIILFAALPRLLFLTTLPPAGEEVLALRLPSAISGVLSIVIFILVIWRLTRNVQTALLSGFFLAILPWHIEQSRVYSEAMQGLLVLLSGVLLWTIAPCRRCKIVLVAAVSILFFRTYASLWLFNPPYDMPSFTEYLGNIFKLLSVEFLFFKNDSFWSGGLRTVGILLPTLIPILLLGLAQVLQKITIRQLLIIIPVVFILVISAANPLFPEGREFFLITPYLAFILSLGGKQLLRFWNRSLVFKILISVYVVFVSYEYAVFGHTYIGHYSQRIQNEIPYEKRTF